MINSLSRILRACAAIAGCLVVVGCAGATGQPVPAQTSLSAPATTTEPAGVATRAPHDSVLEAVVPAQVEYPDVFSAAVLNEDGSVRISYDESSSDAADFIDFVEANSSGDAVIDWGRTVEIVVQGGDSAPEVGGGG